MKRRSKTSGEQAKARRRKTQKSRGAAKSAVRRKSSAAGLQEQLDRKTKELNESLEQQTATSEVLRVISASPGDLKPIFAVVLESATRLCQANFGVLFLCERDAYRAVAMHNAPPAYVQARQREPLVSMTGTTVIAEVARAKRTIQTADMAKDPAYRKNPQYTQLFVRLTGARSFVGVPMLKDHALIGVIGIYRQEVRPFTDKQIALVENFAAQAVIAIENTRLLNETKEALEQQRASAEVLNVISNSVSDAEPVFEKIVESCERIFATSRIGLNLIGPDGLVHAGAYGKFPGAEKLGRENFPHPVPGSATGAAISAGRPIQYPDALRGSDVPEYGRRAAKIVGFRAFVIAPLLSEGRGLGAIFVGRETIGSFSDKEIALLKTFAAQAVIAIENTRLLNELRQRTDDLTESLEQQTAIGEILRVISNSPSDVKPVLHSVAEHAARICQAQIVDIILVENGVMHVDASFGELARPISMPLDRSTVSGRSICDLRPVHVADLQKADDEFARGRDYAHQFGHRSILAVPLIREGRPLGTILVRRTEVRPFEQKDITLLTTFADQAAIAIENVRLFKAEQQRARELSESLEQQTATSEVLRVISSSAGELERVFQSMLENATRLCEAKFGLMYEYVDGTYQALAWLDIPPAFAEFNRQPRVWGPGTALGRVASTKQTVHIADVLADSAYAAEDPGRMASVESAGVKSILVVPMLKEGNLIGAFAIFRQEMRPFSDKQIDLVTNFAAQAVIAIENTRLLNELRQSLEQQTATAEVLSVISSSAGELEPVFNSMLTNAVRICDAKFGTLYICEGETFRPVAMDGLPPAIAEDLWRAGPRRPAPNSTALGRVAATKQTAHIADALSELGQFEPPQGFTGPSLVKLAGARTVLGVPMLKKDELVGAIAIYRQEVRPFTDKQIEVVQNFAAQAVIAIENTRLLNELRQRTTDLTKSLEDLRTAQDRLVQTEKLASLGQLTAGIAHEIKNPLNFVNNFSAVSVELIDELREALGDAHLDSKLHGEITEIADMLQGNLDKVVQHGKRADAIVKNMLLHSRQGSGEHRPVDINALVEESLNLAYHGARAETQGFNITLERFFDPAAGEVDLFPQEITRVLLNLISNGFYAATKRKAEANGGLYEPILAATTKNLGNSVEIRIRDNGTGIPPEVKEKMFNPFFTTKPAGEGTGLGLSISHDIIVKQHSGSIDVDTKPGEFAEFRIVLPRGAATIAKSGEHA